MTALLLAVAAGAALAGWGLTALARRYALARAILDRPNDRSLHSEPTPRGGGGGIVVPVLTATALAAGLGLLEYRTALGLGLGGALVAAVGWLDDRRGLGPAPRLLVQVVAAGGLIIAIGRIGTVDLGVAQPSLGHWGSALALVMVVWCTNLYNFMDGIDGLAGSVAVSTGGIGGALLLAGGAPGLALVAWAAAGASLGFLWWNWPPARIFMGDVGSGLLGFLFAGLALAGERAGAVPALTWILMLGPFVADATLTLFRRVGRGERWYGAHRSHAYQRLVRHGWTHRAVTLTILRLGLLTSVLAVVGWLWRALLPTALAVGGVVLAGAYIFVERWHPMAPRNDDTP